jgi:hypothetical protein
MLISSLARRAATIAVSLGVIAAGTVAASGPASAAVPGPCGSQKTVRTSIHYKSCVIKLGDQHYRGQFLFDNNHGSAVSVFSRVGWSVEGNKHWSSGGSAKTLRAAPGFVQLKTNELLCEPGESITAIAQAKENNGDWGPIAYSRPYTCTN